jgi:hypothetical protein
VKPQHFAGEVQKWAVDTVVDAFGLEIRLISGPLIQKVAKRKKETVRSEMTH